ncbi:MAG: M16 family metallopeptidase [Candidatus Rokuibacteriota bacterium]
MKRLPARVAVLAVAALLMGHTAAAAQPTRGVVEATLDNGLRVLLLEDHRSPIVSVQVWYRVGGRNERPGATGLAHFLEHMMFKGTKRHGKGEFGRIVERNGGQQNAATSADYTQYYVTIAADKLDLILGLEADRMRNLLLDPKEIAAEREVVIEERRTRTEDDPGGFLAEEVSNIAFKAHPYGSPVIGWPDDIRRITEAELRRFYDTYYQPNNAILVGVGDFNASEALAKIRATFGRISRGPAPPPVGVTEPPATSERRVLARKREARLPIVYIAWHVPNHSAPDAAALEVLSQILSGGRAARIYRHLIHERQLALSAGGDYSYLSLDPSLFWFWATPLPGQTPETLEKALLGELDRLRREPVSAEELQRAMNQIEAAFVFQQDSVRSRASLLGRFELIGNYTEANRYLDRLRAVTPSDLQRVAQTWFPEDRRIVGVLLPEQP